MTTTIKTYGMMCTHCEERMNKAMLALKGVTACKSDFKSGDVVIEHTEEFSEKEARDTVLDIGYDLI